jgi:hypothetical protein
MQVLFSIFLPPRPLRALRLKKIEERGDVTAPMPGTVIKRSTKSEITNPK